MRHLLSTHYQCSSEVHHRTGLSPMLVPLNPTSMCVHVPSNTSGSDFKYKHRSTMHQPPFTPAVGAPDPSVPWFGPPTPGTARSNRSVEPLGRTARSNRSVSARTAPGEADVRGTGSHHRGRDDAVRTRTGLKVELYTRFGLRFRSEPLRFGGTSGARVGWDWGGSRSYRT